MKKLLILEIICVLGFAQCLLPVKSYFGLKPGLNYNILDPDDEAGNYTGIGFQIGLGMGIDILNTIGIQCAPTFRTTSFERTTLNVEYGFDYTNLYLPFQLQLKAGMVPMLTPYLGMGFAGNFQLDGEWHLGELSGSVDDLENDLFFSILLGADLKFTKLKISPEFSFNYNRTADDPDTQRAEKNYDFQFCVGLFFAP